MTTKYDATYARYSSHNQDDGTSIEIQTEQCERAAGGKCVQYIDRAKTGRAMNGRPELLRLLADADAGKIGRVFVYKFDRLGRAAETHLIAQQLDDSGAQLVSATEGTNQLARGIQLVVAEDYSRQLASRTRDGLIKRFQQGASTGGIAPYGYRVVERDGRRVLEINPDEAEVIRGVVHEFICESVGFKTIAKRMRARGIASRRGKGWCFTSVRSLLLNPILAGHVRYNARRMQLDRKTGRRVPKWKAETERHERQDESLRIIDAETSARLQERIVQRPGSRHGMVRGVAALTGLVWCQCGSRCTKKTSTRKGHVYHYWICSRQVRYEDCTCAGRVREDTITLAVQDTFSSIFNQSERIIGRAIEIAKASVQQNRGEADRLKGEIARIEGRRRVLTTRLADPEMPPDGARAIYRQLADDEADLGKLHAALDNLREDANGDTERLAAVVRETFEDARTSLASVATPEQFNRFVERFIGPMIVGPDGSISQKQSPAVEATGEVQRIIEGAIPCSKSAQRYCRRLGSLCA